jgi:hypothetical protein
MNKLTILCFLILLASCRQPADPVNIKTDLIHIKIIDNDRGGHGDILFQISGLTDQRMFDSYFFILAMEQNRKVDKLPMGVAKLFQYWREKALMMRENDTIFLPIDFSDEYTGCVKLSKFNNTFNLTYGSSRIMGLNVNPLDPENFYKDVKDFEADSNKYVVVLQKDFINSLDTIIDELKNAR